MTSHAGTTGRIMPHHNTMKIKHDPTVLSRPELIDALRGYVKPSLFQDICYQPTATLRGALLALQCPKEERIAPERPKEPECRCTTSNITAADIEKLFEEIIDGLEPDSFMGLDLALEGDDRTVFGFPVHISQEVPPGIMILSNRKPPSARLAKWLGLRR